MFHLIVPMQAGKPAYRASALRQRSALIDGGNMLAVNLEKLHRVGPLLDHRADRIRPVRDMKEWDEYFMRAERPHLMQSYAFGEAKKHAEGRPVHRYAFDHAGETVAICQVLEKRVAGLQLGSRIMRGPLFFDASPPYKTRESVMRLVRQRWRLFRNGPLLIQPGLELSDENRNIMLKLGFKDRKCGGWWSSLFDLSPNESEMRKRLASNWRNHLKLSENRGLALRSSSSEEALEWMLGRHVENMRAKNFDGPGVAFLRGLYAAKPSDFHILQATLDGVPQAAVTLLQVGQKAEYYLGWFSPAGRRLNCGNFLCWNAALEMKKAGCRWLDLGGLFTPHKYTDFKQGMRGTEYRLMGEWLSY